MLTNVIAIRSVTQMVNMDVTLKVWQITLLILVISFFGRGIWELGLYLVRRYMEGHRVTRITVEIPGWKVNRRGT